MKNPLLKAIDIADGQLPLARKIGVSQGQVWNWLNRDGRPPLEKCGEIERVTGVRCEDLRPDVHWNRDAVGNVTGYTVSVPSVAAAG